MMPIMGHINELRKRLTVIFAVLTPVTGILYMFTNNLFFFLVAPVRPVLPKGFFPESGGVISTRMLDPMMVRFGLAIWAAVVICSPIIIWQSMMFFLPALKPRERKWFTPTFAAAVVLFIFGVVFCYKIVLAASFAWLVEQAGAIMTLLPDAGDLVNVVEFFLLGFGLAFQTPIVVFYLVYFGVVPYKTLRKNWRAVYVVTIIIAAAITPDFSPVSLIALSGAMIVLYEISLALVRIVMGRRIKAEAAAAETLDVED